MADFERQVAQVSAYISSTNLVSRMLKGDIFKFLVGEEKVPFTIHKEILRISEPLYRLATGYMVESRSGYATLEDIDPKTMRLFAEYAYTGIYRSHANYTEPKSPEGSSKSSGAPFYCSRCAEPNIAVRKLTPFCARKASKKEYTLNAYLYCIECGAKSLDATRAYCQDCRKRKQKRVPGSSVGQGVSIRTSSGPFAIEIAGLAPGTTAADAHCLMRCIHLDDGFELDPLQSRLTYSSKKLAAEIVFARKEMAETAVENLNGQRIDGNTATTRVLELTTKQSAFEQRKYPVGDATHQHFARYLKLLKPAVRLSGDLTSHAKLWVFADRYLIKDLKALCLHMLYRELLLFNINQNSVLEIFDFLYYVYDFTPDKDEDDDEVNSGGNMDFNELRDLAISYAACMLNEIREYKEFREMMRNGGDLAADFISLAL